MAFGKRGINLAKLADPFCLGNESHLCLERPCEKQSERFAFP